MNTYELTLVLPGNATPAKVKSMTALVEKLVATFKGKVKKADNWGKIEMAYKIKKNSSGVYLYFELELDPAAALGIKDKVRLDENVIRHLMVRKES